MAKKSNKLVLGGEGAAQAGPAPTAGSPDATASGAKKSSKGSPEIPPSPPSPTLYICRNKHWRYISAFHGPWLQIPVEILETIANINYNTPRPRPIDAAVFFDMLKVRRLVDEATNLAVRAASAIASPTLTNVHGGLPGGQSLHSLGMTGSKHGAKLSRERKFRMREQASQKLARAYRLDEIACSVAIMQGASPIEDVGSLVLNRSPHDSDAQYVQFFHEKIPSRQMAEFTSLEPLTEIISDRSGEPEVFRTRAMVRVFKDDMDGAAQDLTHALSLCRFRRPAHETSEEARPSHELPPQELPRKRRQQDTILTEQDQPSSLESQLLFQRATVYLNLACNEVIRGEILSEEQKMQNESQNTGPIASQETTGAGNTSQPSDGASAEMTESRKMVKTWARRALRDYLSFISQFDYSPDLPIKIADEFNNRVNLASQTGRSSRPSDPSSPVEQHTVYSLSELFAAVAPAGLPPYPSQEVARSGFSTPPPQPTTCEWATFHPLLAEALHSLLLCHCLAQTSAKELQRHAYMVARLIRLSDGYPIFQPSRSPARADWIEVIRRTENAIQLTSPWETLCAPAPLPMYDNNDAPDTGPSPVRAALAAAAMVNGTSADAAAEEHRKENVRQTAILDALDDERVTDEASFRVAVEAREARAERERASPSAGLYPDGSQPSTVDDNAQRRWSTEDGKEYPILSDRAAAVAVWVLEAPVVAGVTKRRRRTKKPVASSKGDKKPEMEEPAET